MNREITGETEKSRLRGFVSGRLRELGITVAEAERRGRLHKGFIGDLLRGTKAGLQAGNIIHLARAINVSPDAISAILAGDIGADGPDVPFPQHGNTNHGPASADRSHTASGWGQTGQESHSIPIELVIGKDMKIQLAVNSATVKALLGVLLDQGNTR